MSSLRRDKAIERIYKKLVSLAKNTNLKKAAGVIFDMVTAWNDANPNEREIFACEYYNDKGVWVGIMVEDDFIVFPE